MTTYLALILATLLGTAPFTARVVGISDGDTRTVLRGVAVMKPKNRVADATAADASGYRQAGDRGAK